MAASVELPRGVAMAPVCLALGLLRREDTRTEWLRTAFHRASWTVAFRASGDLGFLALPIDDQTDDTQRRRRVTLK